MKKLIRILSVGLIVFAPLLAAPSVYAASASLSLSPSSSSITQGSTLTVSIYENSGAEPVNAAKASLNYPTNLLDFVSIGSSSAFGIVAANSGGGGSVNIDRGALPAVSGKQLLATVRFKAKTNSGTASVVFSGDNKVVSASSNQNILTGTTGGTYTLKAPVAAPPAAPPPPKDTTPPILKDIAIGGLSTNSATVTWTSSEPATSQVDYGLNTGYGLTAGDNNFVTTHKLVLNSALLSPGTEYHFVVKSVDPAGNAVSSQDQIFTTKGATLVVSVIDQHKNPVSQAEVTIDNITGITDKGGKVTITGLQIGRTVGVVGYKGKQTVASVEVKPIDPKGVPQAITLTIQKPGSHIFLIVLPLLLLFLLVVALLRSRGGGGGDFKGLGGFLSRVSKGKNSKGAVSSVSKTSSSGEAPSPTVVRPTIPPRG